MTPQWMALLLLAILALSSQIHGGVAADASADCDESVRAVLIAGSKQLDPNGTYLAWWSNTTSCHCDGWNVVSCQNGTVTNITLQGYGFQGELPTGWSALTGLKILDLQDNYLTSSLPASWSAMAAIETLKLTNNSLSGTLPAEWGAMAKVETIHVGDNGLTGTLPRQWSSLQGLAEIDVSSNNITGPLPADWSALSRAESLFLSNNSLTGTLPQEWAAMPSVADIDVSQNQLSGTLPAEWSGLLQVTSIHVYENRLTGPLPIAWSAIGTLEELITDDNRLSGTLPAEYSSLANLTILAVEGMNFTGSLPPQWGALTRLDYLGVSGNKNLTGPLPAQWSTLRATHMFMTGCNFTGTLPAEWGALNRTMYLHVLVNRHLAGTLPAEWSGMAELRALSFGNTSVSGTLPAQWSVLNNTGSMSGPGAQLTGTLPKQWSAMRGMKFLFLYNNQLAGTLPSEYSVWENATSMSFGTNQLSGELPASWAAWKEVAFISLYGNNLTGTLPVEWSSLGADSLALSNNSLSGSIPAEWSAMVNLMIFSVAFNKLTGSLPDAGLGGISGPANLDVSNNQISGTLPSSWGSSTDAFFWDFSNNKLQGGLPASWSNFSSMIYLGLHGNPSLCTDQTSCFNNIASSAVNMPNLQVVSTDGGHSIPSAWCNTTLPNGRSVLLTYVDQQPTFDACLSTICLAPNPSDYSIRYVDRLHMGTALSWFSDSKTDLSVTDTATISRLSRQINTIVTSSNLASDGWLLGTGGWNDPCLDRRAGQITTIIFIVFGTLLALIVLDGLRQMVCCQRPWHQAPLLKYGKYSALVAVVTSIGEATGSVLHFGGVIADIVTDILVVIAVAPRLPAWLLLGAIFISDFVTMLYIHWVALRSTKQQQHEDMCDRPDDLELASITKPPVIDGPPGETLVTNLLPTTTDRTKSKHAEKYLESTADAFAPSNITQHKLPLSSSSSSSSYVGSGTDSKPTKAVPCCGLVVATWSDALHKMYSSAANSRGVLRLLLGIALAPLLSITVNCMSPVLGVWLFMAVVAGTERSHSWAFMRTLDVRKCCELRALLVVLIESPASIAFTTWAYLTPFKNPVGVIVNSTIFLVSLCVSMAHMVFELWKLKQELVRTRSVANLLRYKLDIGLVPAAGVRVGGGLAIKA